MAFWDLDLAGLGATPVAAAFRGSVALVRREGPREGLGADASLDHGQGADRGLDHRRHELSEEGQALGVRHPAVLGQLGKQDNCQVAVSLSLANAGASFPIADRLYLPKDWAADPARRKKTGVPEEVTFRTKPEIALDQIRAALEAGAPPGVVLMDAGYGADTSLRSALWSLQWLTREIGEATRLADINGGVVARLIAKRRGRRDVNRTVTEPLAGVLNRARLWGEPLPLVEWRKHMLPEPRERVRELRADEEETLFATLRPDYHPVVRFALLSGCRLAECVGLTWANVDWGGRVIWITGKGGKRASTPLPPAIRELLWPLQGQHPTAVFTYAAERGGVRSARAGEIRHSQHEDVLTAMEAAAQPIPTKSPTMASREKVKAEG